MSDVNITFKASDQTAQAAKSVESRMSALRSQITGLQSENDKALESTSGLNVGFGELSGAIGILTGAFTAMKQAYDWGEEGAKILQASRSFDLLGEKVGASTTLLEQLRAASLGTVDDLTLMNSTSLLLAGTSGELGKALADASPQLMEIAKAAQKLNPQLGDVTYMYDSLARGIKRSSPLILDNLGLVIKVGDANKAYADSVGKSVEQLTAEEKKIALLNDVLSKGQVMLDQVGGSTQSASDGFDRLGAAIKNVGNELKTFFGPAAGNVATALSLLVGGTREVTDVLKIHETQVQATSSTYEAYLDEMARSVDVTKLGSLQHYEYIKSTYGMADAANYLSQYVVVLTEGQFNLAKITRDTALYIDNLNVSANGAAGSGIKVLALSEQELNEIQNETYNKADLVRDRFRQQEDAAGAAALANLGFAESLKSASQVEFAVAAIDVLQEKMRAQGASEAEVAAATDVLATKFGLVDERSKALANSIQTSADLIATGSIPIEKLGDLYGLVWQNAGKSDEKVTKFIDLNKAAPPVIDTATSAVDRQANKFLELEGYTHNVYTNLDSIMKLPEQKDIYVNVHYNSSGKGGSSAKDSWMETGGFASGGSFTVGSRGGSSATDSQLVAFWATPGEQVHVNPPGTERTLGDSKEHPTIQNTYYINVTANGDGDEIGDQIVAKLKRMEEKYA